MGARVLRFVGKGNERGVSLVDLAVSQRLGRGPIPEYGPGEQARQALHVLSKGGILLDAAHYAGGRALNESQIVPVPMLRCLEAESQHLSKLARRHPKLESGLLT
jgi:hypothetical protein